MTEADKPEAEKGSPAALLLGTALTGAWFLVIVIFTKWKWGELHSLQPNEWGDLAAGAAAPLAFLWLVIAVLLQKAELSLQRTELRESREAHQKQARETEALVARNTQAVRLAQATLEDQRRGEEEARLDRLIDLLAKRMLLRSPDLMIRKYNSVGDHRIFAGITSQHDSDETFKIALTELAARAGGLSQDDEPVNGKVLKDEVEGLLRWLATILEGEQQGAFPVLRARIEMLELQRFHSLLGNVHQWLVGRGL